jgi:hypothetical protein
MWHRPVLLPDHADEDDGDVTPVPRLLEGTSAAGLVVALRLAVRSVLPHGVGRVDVWQGGGL